MEKLLKSNFRKGRAGLVVVTLFIVLAVFLLTSGLTLAIKAPTLFDEKEREIDSPDMAFDLKSFEGVDFSDEIVENMRALPYVDTMVEKEYASVKDDTSLYFPTMQSELGHVWLLNKDWDKPMMPKFVTEAEGTGIPLYFTYYYKVQGHIPAGEKLKLKIHGVTYDAYCAGFYETVTALYAGTTVMYTDEATYQMVRELQKEDEFYKATRYRTFDLKFKEPYGYALRSRFIKDYGGIYEACRSDFIAELQQASPIPIPEDTLQKVIVDWSWYGVEITRDASEPYMLLLSVMMIVFSVVMTAVALLIINFLIRSGIEEDMRNIGILKGLGYATKQLRGSYLAMYGILIAVGSVLGMITAVLLAPVFDRILLLITNLPMSVPPNGYAAAGSVVLVVIIALAAVWSMTRKLKGITPLFALRGAISPHSFKKNSAPLDRSKLGLNTTLALKSVFQNKRQSIMSFVIVGVMTLITAFSFVMYYNMNVDKTAMIAVAGEETNDISINTRIPDAKAEDYAKIREFIASDPRVERVETAVTYGWSGWIQDDFAMAFRVADHYEGYEINPVYEGRNPTLPTECAVAGDIKNALGLRLGDVVRLSLAKGISNAEPVTKTFTVVGFTQGLYLTGAVSVTSAGFDTVFEENNFISGWWYVYLKPDVTVNLREMSAEIRAYAEVLFPNLENPDETIQISMINNLSNVEEKVFKIVSPASALLMDVILAVTAIVIAAVVFMIVRMKMIREKRNTAILKAVGYTSPQLMHQSGLSMLLIALPAALLGGLMGAVLVNPFMNLIGGLIGLYKVTFNVHYGFILAISMILGALNYFVALLVSMSTRFVTPRMLVSNS